MAEMTHISCLGGCHLDIIPSEKETEQSFLSHLYVSHRSIVTGIKMESSNQCLWLRSRDWTLNIKISMMLRSYRFFPVKWSRDKMQFSLIIHLPQTLWPVTYHIVGHFCGRKLSWISRFVAICASFFSAKFWGHGIFWQHQRAICESFLHENLIFCKWPAIW